MNKDKTRQDKTRQDKTRQDKTRQDNYDGSFERVKCIGYIEKGTGKHQSNCVYSVEGLSPTICAGLGVKMPGLYIVVD